VGVHNIFTGWALVVVMVVAAAAALRWPSMASRMIAAVVIVGIIAWRDQSLQAYVRGAIWQRHLSGSDSAEFREGLLMAGDYIKRTQKLTVIGALLLGMVATWRTAGKRPL
jgi:hypothetical protein